MAAPANADPLPSGSTSYRHLGDYQTVMDGLVAKRPDLVKAIALTPPSLEGRTLTGVEITHHVGRRDGKPVFLMLGLHHAREWPSGELSLEFADDLVRSDGKDARITKLLARARVIVIPVVNPDGFSASRESPVDPTDPNVGSVVGIPGNGTSYRRKNCRASGQTGLTQPPSSCDDNPGVDINRNYGISWGSNGASSFEAAPDYRGAFPFSEPETEAIRRLVSTRSVTMLITNHTFGGTVLRPPGVKSVGTVPDEPNLKAIGDSLAKATGYTSEYSWQLYDNSGTTEDWSYGVTGGYGYTIESNRENFHPAYDVGVVAEYPGNREAYLRALEAAADPRYHARIEGFAPPGRVLRLKRTVESDTGPVCVTQPTGFFSTPCPASTKPLTFEDTLDVTRTVGASGAIDWDVNPSVSPEAVIGPAWDLSCETPDGQVLGERKLEVARGTAARVSVVCGQPRCPDVRVTTGRRQVIVRTAGRTVRVRQGRRVLTFRAHGQVRRVIARGGRRAGVQGVSGCGELRTARLRGHRLVLRSRYALRVRVGTRSLHLRPNRTRRLRVAGTRVTVRTARGTPAATRRTSLALRA